MVEGLSIPAFAGLTAAVGMGVVFVALFAISLYMHYFKLVTARLENATRGRAPPAAKPPRRAAPSLTPGVAARPTEEDASPIAAAVAMALHLRGVRGAPREEVAAAVGVALAMHRGRSVPAVADSASGWRLAGRMEALGSRATRYERPRS